MAGIGYAWRKWRTKGKPIARCRSDHPLTEEQVAEGVCWVEGCPTRDLFPEQRDQGEDT